MEEPKHKEVGGLHVEGHVSPHKDKEAEEQPEEPPFRSDLVLIGVVVTVLIALGVLFGARYFFEDGIQTVDDLHLLNQDGKLKEEGDVYNGFSFVFLDGLWYTQVASRDGSALFDVPFHNLPRQVDDIAISGELDAAAFDASSNIYVTFDPLGSDLQYVALAIGKFDQTMLKAYNKIPVAACDRNETIACATRPIVTCDSKGAVMAIQQMDSPAVVFDDNCIQVQGRGTELVRAMERLLFSLYGIIP